MAVGGYWIGLIPLLVLAPLVESQTVCERFEAVPQPCQSFLVGNWSWISTAPSAGLSQEVLLSRMLQVQPVLRTATSFVSRLDALTLLDVDCGEAYARALCLASLSPCDPVLSQPVAVCRSVCLRYLQVCGDSAPVKDLCNERNPITNDLIFQDTVDCTSNSDDDFIVEPFVYPCPKPTIYRPNLSGASLPCKTPCREQLYALTSKQKFDDLFITISVFSWISMFAALAVLAVYAYFPVLHEYPSRLAVFVTLGNLSFNIAWVGNSVQNPEDFMCDSNGVDLKSSGWCAFSAFALFYGLMSLATWWCIQVLVMTYNVGFMQYEKQLDRKYEWLQHVWGWSYPIVSALLICFVPDGHAAGASGVVPYCTGTIHQLQGLRWGLLTGVTCGYILLAGIGLFITLCRIVSMGLKSSLSTKTQVTAFLSIFAFGLWYLVAASSAVVQAAYQQATLDQAAASSYDRFLCWLTTNDRWKECPQSFMFDYGVVWWGSLMTALTGIVLFLVFIPMNPTVRQAFISRSSSLAVSASNP